MKYLLRMNLNEDISRLKKLMGIISEQENFPDYQQLHKEWEKEQERKSGEIDSALFDEFYDNLKDRTFFSFKGLIDKEGWRDEDDNSFTKNENKIISTFPTVGEINSWKEWVNSPYWESTHFYFSKRRDTELTMYGPDGSKTMKYHEEPTSQKKMYFEMYLSQFGPMLIKKK